jgi:hypothetical protein
MAPNPVDEIAALAGEPKHEEETVSEYLERLGEAAEVDPDVVDATKTYVTGSLFAPGTPDGEDAYRTFREEVETLGEPPADGASEEEAAASDDEPADGDDEAAASDDGAAPADVDSDRDATTGSEGDATTAEAIPARVRRAVGDLPEPTRRQAIGGAALLLGGAGAASLYADDGLSGLLGDTAPSVGPTDGSPLVVGAGERVVLTDARSAGSLQWADGGVLAWHDGATLTLGGDHQ